jgi:hypothetical protein
MCGSIRNVDADSNMAWVYLFMPRYSSFCGKGSANREKNQIYLDFSKVPPNLWKGSANREKNHIYLEFYFPLLLKL